MFNADNWQEVYEHKTYCAKVYIKGDKWHYEYQGNNYVYVGMEASADEAMREIEHTITAGIYIKKRVDE